MEQTTTVSYYAEHYANNPQVKGFISDAGLLHQILEVTKLEGDQYQLTTLRTKFRRGGETIVRLVQQEIKGKVRK